MADQHEPYTVVVGVSATSKSPTALVWGHAQARANRGRLIALRAHAPTRVARGSAAASSPTRGTEAEVLADEQRQLEHDVAEVLGPDHGAEVVVVRGSKYRTLLQHAREADLLVVDASRTPSTSLVTAQRLLSAATCPVVVMPPSIAQAPASAVARSVRSLGRASLRAAGTSGRPGYRPPSATSI